MAYKYKKHFYKFWKLKNKKIYGMILILIGMNEIAF